MKIIEILLVDDDKGDIKLTKKALENSQMKLNIHVTYNGVEALQFLRKEGPYAKASRPDLILLDLNMPVKDGRATLEEIKHDENLKDIPIVILTTSAEEEDIAKSYKAGCNCYVSKPVDMTEFAKILKVFKEFWFTIAKLP